MGSVRASPTVGQDAPRLDKIRTHIMIAPASEPLALAFSYSVPTCDRRSRLGGREPVQMAMFERFETNVFAPEHLGFRRAYKTSAESIVRLSRCVRLLPTKLDV